MVWREAKLPYATGSGKNGMQTLRRMVAAIVRVSAQADGQREFATEVWGALELDTLRECMDMGSKSEQDKGESRESRAAGP